MPLPNIGAILSSPLQIGGNKTETEVAKAWLRTHWEEWDRIEFNVGLGPGLNLGPGVPAYVQKAATASTKPRADMILYRGQAAAIVEVKGRIGPSVMGQLLTYWHILHEDRPDLVQIYKIAAGNTIQAGQQPILERYGISVELFWIPANTAA
jgi:hypothetical protein